MVSSSRQQQKAATREAILRIASRRLREGGPGKVGIASVMSEAGLTHGGFYAHFQNKEALTVAAFIHAIDTNQPGWFAYADKATSFDKRLARLAEYYLTPQHRDNCGNGCAIAALASGLDGASRTLKEAYAIAVEQTIDTIAEQDSDRRGAAAVFLSTITGALNLARNTSASDASDQILDATIVRYAG